MQENEQQPFSYPLRRLLSQKKRLRMDKDVEKLEPCALLVGDEKWRSYCAPILQKVKNRITK